MAKARILIVEDEELKKTIETALDKQATKLKLRESEEK